MTLRTRLVAVSIAVAVPLAVAVGYVNDRVRLGDMEQTLRRFVESDIASGAAERCEARPVRFGQPPPQGGRGRGGGRGERGGPPPPPRAPDSGPYELFAYSSDFAPADPRAPALPVELRQGLSSGDSRAASYWTPDGRGIAIAFPLGDVAGPCAFVMARMPPRRGTLQDQLAALGLVIVSVLAAVLIAAGPVVSRMRRLGDAVSRSAESHYATPVTVAAADRDEVGDLSRAFNAAGATVRQHLLDVQSRQEALRQFVANTTHDVALPLTVVQGHLTELEQATADRPAVQAEVREAMQEAHYMSSLLRNLGAAAKLEGDAQSLDRHPIDLSALVDRVVARHRTLARARQVHLDFAVPETPTSFNGDVTLLEQVLSNIVDNAVQYNRPGGHVAIVLDRRGPDRFVITIADDGPGVTEEELVAMRGRHARGSEARSRRPEGQGLGLAIAEEAAARLGLHIAFRRPAEGGLSVEIAS